MDPVICFETECSKNDTVPVCGLSLKGPAASAFVLFLETPSHHMQEVQLPFWKENAERPHAKGEALSLCGEKGPATLAEPSLLAAPLPRCQA